MMSQRIQPLSYQVHLASCWVTSVLNALLVLKKNKNDIPTLAYRLLNAVLTNDGVLSGGKKKEWEIVLGAISLATDIKIDTYFGDDVEIALTALEFKRQVAVCDIQGRGHSILLTGRKDNKLEGFDPDWENIKEEKNDGYLWTYPNSKPGTQCHVNFEVDIEHFLRINKGTPLTFRMGEISKRTLTVFDHRRSV